MDKLNRREKIIAWCFLMVAQLLMEKLTEDQRKTFDRLHHELYVG